MGHFTDYSFPVTGSQFGRTQPDRLADYYNVKEFGAIGNNSSSNATVDTNGIQGAINACIAGGGGTVYLPQGVYYCNKPFSIGSNTKNVGVRIMGAGKNGTLFTTAPGFSDPTGVNVLFASGSAASPPTYDCIDSLQGLGHISCRCARAGVSVDECDISTNTNAIGCDVTQAKAASIRNCNLGSLQTISPEQVTDPNLQTLAPNSVGFAIASGSIMACRGGSGVDIPIAISGSGCYAVANSFEVAQGCYKVGWGPATPGASFCSEVPAIGVVIESLQTERVNIPVILYNVRACLITGMQFTGGFGPTPDYGGLVTVLTAASLSGGIATVTSAVPHNLPSGTTKLCLIINLGTGANSGWIPDQTTTQTGWILATRVDSTRFSYPLSGSPPAYNSGDPLKWSYSCQFGFRFRKVTDCLITACDTGGRFLCDYDFAFDGSANVVHNNNSIRQCIGGTGAALPAAANITAWAFDRMFLNSAGTNGIFGDRAASVYGITKFANLPGQSGVNQVGPFESQEFTIIDSATAPSGNFGAVISSGTGSPANTVKLRRNNSSQWTISG